jgi:hypothetical protein
MTRLVLKAARASRPSGEWKHEDYDVLADRTVVGRILEEGSASTPPELRWFWSITEVVRMPGVATKGHASTLDEAKAKFRDNWTRAVLGANAYQEAGHAIVGWALGGRVHEIRIRDDRPGEHAQVEFTESLSLLDQIAIHNAGRQSEELFGHSLPSWASTRDRTDCINAITAEGVRATAKIAEWIDRGCGRARELLQQRESDVHRLAARLIECRHMDADTFARFMEGANG